MVLGSLLRKPSTYVMDANVFVAAYQGYYAPNLCPGFWDVLEHFSIQGNLLSIDRVRAELIYPDRLVEWANGVSDGMFVSSAEQAVVQTFSEMQRWVRQNEQFSQAAEDEFARAADGWLAAYAKVHNAIVVTHEKLRPDAKKRVPIPNLCRQFGINYQDTFDVLGELGVRFDWK